jgi:nucleoside-diphosphate-sugar epimerase
MRVFVAGATGAIGRPLVPQLIAAGHEVTGMTRSERGVSSLREAGAGAALVDVFDADALGAAMAEARPEVVVHQLTAIPEDLDPRKMEEQFEATNRVRTEGTRNLLAAARASGAGRFIAQSIAFAYAPREEGLHGEDDPLWAEATRIYAAVQEMEGLVLDAEGLDGLVLRYGFFYGPGTGYAPDGGSAKAVRKRQFPVMGRGQGQWPFIHIDDAASATVAAVERGAPGVYNVVDDDPAPLREWLPAFAEAIGAKKPFRVPKLVARLAAGKMAAHYGTAMRGASNDKAKRELAWSPHYASWREGFREGLG